MTKIYSLLIILFIIACCNSKTNAQTRQLSTKSDKAIAYYNQAVKYYQQQQFKNAIDGFEEAIRKDNEFAEAYIKLANAYRLIGEKTKARDLYTKGFGLLSDKEIFPTEHFHYAEYLMLSGDYTGAEEQLNYYFNAKNPTVSLRKQAEKLRKNLAFAIDAIKNPVDFKPVRLPDNINQFHHQYFPAITADEQYFLYTARIGPNPSQDEDIYLSRKVNGTWTTPQPISPIVNSSENEGAASISGDGKTLVFTGCSWKDSFGSCDLYISYKEGDDWSKPVNLGNLVNSTSWDSNPTLSADGRTIFFSSGRAGGQGKLDIWQTTKNNLNEWARPVNLGPVINTEGDETAPCIHASGSTLYFASDGHPGMGGVDLFKSDFNDGVWSNVVNLGYPLNTTANESTILIDAANNKGYFSKDIGGGRVRRIELFQFDVPRQWKSKVNTAYAKGKVYDAFTKKPLSAVVDVYNLNDNQLNARVNTDKKTGEYIVVLNEGAQLGMFANAAGYLPNSIHFDYTGKKELDPQLLDIYLHPIAKGESVVLENLFFETNKYTLQDKSKTELDKLISFLKENSTVKIEISGHTDDIGSDDANQVLSEKRAKTVQSYLGAHGINIERIIAKGYGESKPARQNTNEENRAKNRRIEMRII